MTMIPPLAVRAGRLISYSCPYILTAIYREDTSQRQRTQKKEFHIWKYINNTTQPSFISTLQADIPDRLEHTVFTDKHVCSVVRLPEGHSRFLIFRIEDGAFTDSKDIYAGTLQTTEPGCAAYVGSTNGLFAILRIGEKVRGPDTTIEVHKISGDGKLVLKNELRSNHPLAVSWEPLMWRVPDLVHLSETDFVGSLKLGLNHDVHFLRWTLNSSTSLPSHAQFSSYIETDESDEEEFISTFKAHFDLSSSPIHALIIAHEESFEIEESRPNTTIRSIDPTTFELNWCTPFEQNMLAMGIYEPLNLLVMIGNGHTSRYINLIDIKTGVVRRRDEMNMDNGVSKIHISSQGELVATSREGGVTVMRIPDIMEHGYAAVLADTAGEFAVSRISCPNPALAAGEVQKDDTRMEVKYWMQGASLLGDGMVLLGDHDSIRYVIASWR